MDKRDRRRKKMAKKRTRRIERRKIFRIWKKVRSQHPKEVEWN